MGKTTQQKQHVSTVIYNQLVRQGYDPEEIFKLASKNATIAAGEKANGIPVHYGSEVFDKPLMLRRFDGIACGIEDLDKQYLLGFKPGDLVVMAGGSSIGKSSTTMFWAINMARNGVPVLTYNFEDTTTNYEGRLQKMCRGHNIKKEELATNFQYYNMVDMGDFIKTPMSLIPAIKAKVTMSGIKVVIIDMINDLVKVNTADQADEMVNNLHALAAELGIVIIFTAKLRKPAGLTTTSRTREYYFPTAECIAGFNAIEYRATKVLTVSHIPDTVGLKFKKGNGISTPTYEPFAIHVPKCRDGDRTIDAGVACVCQWVKYNDKTILDVKGIQSYDIPSR